MDVRDHAFDGEATTVYDSGPGELAKSGVEWFVVVQWRTVCTAVICWNLVSWWVYMDLIY